MGGNARSFRFWSWQPAESRARKPVELRRSEVGLARASAPCLEEWPYLTSMPRVEVSVTLASNDASFTSSL